MNAIIPKQPRVGDRLSATQLAQVMQAIRRYMPIAGTGVRVSHGVGGSVISIKPNSNGGGLSVGSKLIPWTCEWHTELNSAGEVEYENYGFFLPNKGTLQYFGSEINFQQAAESSYINPIRGMSDWLCFSEIGWNGESGEGYVYCEIINSSGLLFGNLCMEENISSSSVLTFPVVWLKEVKNIGSEGETTSISRSIQQLEYGNEVINEGDVGPFRYSRTSSDGGMFTHNYFEQENVTRYLSDSAIDSGLAGNFLWLELDSVNTPMLSYGNFSDMVTREMVEDISVAPLYKFDSDANIEIDLRNIPTIQEWMMYNGGSSS